MYIKKIYLYNIMKKTTWLIKIFFDDEKKNLMYQEEFESVKAVRKKFVGLKRDFLYDFQRKKACGLLDIKTSRKKKCLIKYKRMIIVKTTFGEDGPKQFVLDL